MEYILVIAFSGLWCDYSMKASFIVKDALANDTALYQSCFICHYYDMWTVSASKSKHLLQESDGR